MERKIQNREIKFAGKNRRNLNMQNKVNQVQIQNTA